HHQIPFRHTGLDLGLGIFHAGVVEQDVQAPILSHRELDHTLGLGLAHDIRLDKGGFATGRLDPVRDRLPFLRLHVSDHHLGPFFGEEPGCSLADARRSASDQRHFAFKSAWHIPPFLSAECGLSSAEYKYVPSEESAFHIPHSALRIRTGYCAVYPPSITSSDPVTNDDSSDAR